MMSRKDAADTVTLNLHPPIVRPQKRLGPGAAKTRIPMLDYVGIVDMATIKLLPTAMRRREGLAAVAKFTQEDSLEALRFVAAHPGLPRAVRKAAVAAIRTCWVGQRVAKGEYSALHEVAMDPTMPGSVCRSASRALGDAGWRAIDLSATQTYPWLRLQVVAMSTYLPPVVRETAGLRLVDMRIREGNYSELRKIGYWDCMPCVVQSAALKALEPLGISLVREYASAGDQQSISALTRGDTVPWRVYSAACTALRSMARHAAPNPLAGDGMLSSGTVPRPCEAPAQCGHRATS